ncbi:HigA family addiction module antitoxin [Beijerinckia indica]|uniref:Putative plasmid maintenance system antidote protein, XRE family n=1 Tax=Beijerinckia indica subsp. indica (strain ATCC 9039 / DSM 1715 / NCIMB 8712) TaxID=395963 RepID=B2IDR1_BEII9|nr:HigA family addiction module antitoxin [Beijerinckia indica]ACB96843.1 putative plasmid maintenance system antidote protein, XRE family [Beijerinckia indica subsp. indica ATCC 9039]
MANPARKPKHPGLLLQDIYLADLGISGATLAAALRVPSERIAALFRGAEAVDADLAIRLGLFFDKDPAFWLDLQRAYDLAKARDENDYTGIEKHGAISSFFP